MSGLKTTVATTFSDTTLPILRDDPVLPVAGALLLLEPNHPANPMVGVPASGGLFPNIAYSQSKALIPAGDASTLSGTMYLGATYDTECVRERSGKGGLHFLVPQATPGLSTREAAIQGPILLGTYASNNATHSWFISLWTRATRLGLSTTGYYPQISSGQANDWQFYRRLGATGDTEYPTSARRIGYRGINTKPAIIGQGSLHNIGLSDTIGSGVAWMFRSGNATYNVGDYGKGGSHIFYRCYIEDLTVSGRTYATVDALDYAEYTKQVNTAGGRYYGDTYRDPATVTP